MDATSLPQFLDALVAALQARPGLDGVNIFSCPAAPDDLGLEGIDFADVVDIEHAPQAMSSRTIEEKYEVAGSLLVTAPLGPSGINPAAKAARDRCEELLMEILDELSDNDTMSGAVRDVSIASQSWHQGERDEFPARVCWVDFKLAVESSVAT